MKQHKDKHWKVKPLWVGLFAAAAGSAITIEGVLRLSVPIGITGIAITLAAPEPWVLWAIVGMFLSLWTGRQRQRRP